MVSRGAARQAGSQNYETGRREGGLQLGDRFD
jgi:hypothetical protein